MSLPTGTVTFLFTDIEGSTKLAREYRLGWEALRARHHAILREAIETCDGYVFQIVGDAFCAAFSTAEQAIRAAVKAQMDLNAEHWREAARIKVRMGIHTGKAELQEGGDYLGYMAMSRVQGLMSVAYGGQVLLSLAAQNQVAEDLPQGVTLRDMGEHQLKNIVQPEHISQLVIAGLPANFPPLQTSTSLSQPPLVGLVVRLLGRFEIKVDNQPVHLSARAAQSMFAYLILHAGIPQRREKLAGMFWPDETEDKARAHLRNELWRIRKALGARSNAEYLSADDLGICFNSSSDYWLDVNALKRLKNTSSSDELMGSLALTVGELLPGFYEDWITAEREHLHATYEQHITRLLSLLEVEKRWNDILDWAERWISLDEGPEAAYRALMTAYEALGDRTKVTSTYQRCVRALRELDLEPSEQTRALAFKRSSKLYIPLPLTSFIGRKKVLEEVTKLLSKHRLVTLTGSGGVGKTRLAIQVVADLLELFPDGVWFLDLAPLNDPKIVPNTLAGVLDLQLMSGSDPSFTDLIASYLRSRKALIIFDNCEHLIESCAQLVHSLLTSCEHLSVLATSREALRVEGEIPYRVPSLELPSWNQGFAVDALGDTESVRLFAERAAVVSRGFVLSPQNAFVIAKICERLDGIPLAIELAAARANMLTVHQILERLDDRFNLLTSGLRTTLPRHRTLRATIEWSYDLLSEKECLLFQRLAVFVGGWTLEAAEEVCSDKSIKPDQVLDLLSQLVQKSLVLVDAAPYGTRYHRLETIRQFVCEKLAVSPEEELIRSYHLRYFLKLAQEAELGNPTPKKMEWVDKLEDEQENMRAALQWSLQADVKRGQQLVVALRWWWDRKGPSSGGYEWVQKMLAAPLQNETPTKAKLLEMAGFQALMLGYDQQAVAYAEEALALFRQLGDKNGTAAALSTLGARASFRSEFHLATKLLEESCALYIETGNKSSLASLLCVLGSATEAQGNFEQAQEFYEESLSLSREIGDEGGIAWALYFLAGLANYQRNDAKAMKLYEESLHHVQAIKQKAVMSFILSAMGSVAMSNGEFEKGRALLNENIDLCEKIGDRGGMAYSLHYLAWGALLQGDHARARSLYARSFQLPHPIGPEIYVAEALIGAAQLLGAQGDLQAFTRLLGMTGRVVPDYHTLLVPPLFISETEKFVEMARAALGKDAYTATWEAGCQLNLQEAIAYALKELQSW